MDPYLKIASHDNGERLDAVLARTYPQYSRVFFQKFMKKGGVTLSGSPRDPSYRVRVGEVFQIADFESELSSPAVSSGGSTLTSKWIPGLRPPGMTARDPDIIYEDDAMLVIDKPAGLVVHPAPGHRAGTLTDWLKQHLGASVTKVFTDPERLGLVHRLDKDTSGVLVIAKSIIAQTAISRQFHDRTVRKTYAAIVEGVPPAKTGLINAPVGRARKARTRMAVTPLGRESETEFVVNEPLKEVAQVTLHPKTGRTHQIRVHLAAIGHPIVGDHTYGAKSVWAQTYGIHRPLLHAEQLEINHPTTGKRVAYKAPWPQDFQEALKVFRRAFKSVGILLAAGVLMSSPALAQDPASAPAKKSSPGPLTQEVRRLKRDVAALQESMSNLNSITERMGSLEDRMKDIERAVSDLNSKAVAGGAGSEETKTQLLEINRRLKSDAEALNQLRDQLDRLNRQVIRQQSTGGAPSTGTGAGGPP